MLDQTVALPSRNKCQHDEGEGSNAVLSLLRCLVDSKKGGMCDECGAETDTHFYLSAPVCEEEGVQSIEAEDWGLGRAIQSEDVCWLTRWKQWMDMAQFGPGRFLPDAAREDIQEWVQDKMGRSAQERQVSPDVWWVNSLWMLLLSAQTITETSVKENWTPYFFLF